MSRATYKPTFEDHMRRFAVGDIVVCDWGAGTVVEVGNMVASGMYLVEIPRHKPRKVWVDTNRWIWQWIERQWFMNYQLRPITLLDALAVASAVPSRKVEPDSG